MFPSFVTNSKVCCYNFHCFFCGLFSEIIFLVKMYEYHVTYGAFKKIIKSGSNIAKDIHEPIKKAFLLDSTSSLHLQYFHARHNDWVDCEETDEMTNDTKLNVWQK